MANRMENLGLDFLMEDEYITNFLGLIVKEGKPIPNYHQLPHFFAYFGDSEFWAGTELAGDGHYSVNDLDTHAAERASGTW